MASGQVAQRASGLLHSASLWVAIAATALLAVAVPAAAFLLVGLGLVSAAYVASPLLPRFRLPKVHLPKVGLPSFQGGKPVAVKSRGGKTKKKPVELPFGKAADRPKERIPRGKATGDKMTDVLVGRLGAMGLIVSTDWKFAQKILDELPDKRYDNLRQHPENIHGFVFRDVIYINPEGNAPATPIHEYAHVWAEVLRQKNPEEWRHIVDLMKQEQVLWDKVKESYPHLENDDQIADEVLATYSGHYGAQLLREHFVKGGTPESILDSVSESLKRFWSAVCEFFNVGYNTAEDVADMVMASFLRGVNPLDYAEQGREKLSDNVPLHAVFTDDDKHENEKTNMIDNEERTILTGSEAQKVLGEILASECKSGNVIYPAHEGVIGYFQDVTGAGDKVFTAFDNVGCCCFVEDFKTAEGALAWCRGTLDCDEVWAMEEDVDTILLNRDSFRDWVSFHSDKFNGGYPAYVRFDENGEFECQMHFRDGCAVDTNPHGLGYYDRVGLYYPTLSEVMNDEDKQRRISDFTGRNWQDGSEQEKIHDIAVTFGSAGRIHCPQERQDAAVQAVADRVKDPRATSFTVSQREAILLAVSCKDLNDDRFGRSVFYDSLLELAKDSLGRVNPGWIDDVYDELHDMVDGNFRGESRGRNL